MKTLINYIPEMENFRSLNEYINESRYFKLTEGERAAIASLVGLLTGNTGEDEDAKKYAEYWGVLSDDEQQQMNDLYDVLDDTYNWPVINRNNIKDDIELLANFLNWVDENDLWGDYEYDGPGALEKLES